MQYNESDGHERIVKAFCCLQANILMNAYTAENVVFKHIKPYTQLPYEKYIDDLGFQSFTQYLDIAQMDGAMIENGCIKDTAYDEICFALYRDKIDDIFFEAPKYSDSYNDYDEDIYHYKHGLYEYLKELYPLFREIIAVEVTPDFFDTIPDTIDKTEQRQYDNKITKFITAIKLKHLRQGSCVDRYIKDLPFVSPLILRLLNKHKGRYRLANNNTDSIDYKLALLSCFRFYSSHNAKLFELKLLRWEELNRNPFEHT